MSASRLASALVVVVAAGPAARGDEPCRPVARVSGEPGHTQAVLQLLGERGVDGTGVSTCGVVSVSVEAEGERLRLRLTDAEGRRAERLADDAEVAATIIESWVRTDVSAPLLAARLPARTPVEGAVVRASAPGRRLPRYEVGLGPQAGAGSDGSTWAGGRGRACVYFEAWCLGVLAHYGLDTGWSGASAELRSERQQLGLLLALARPFRLGPVVLSPGLAVGQLTLTSHRDGMDGADDDDDENPSSLAVEAHLGGAVHLGGAWALRADAVLADMPLVERRFHDAEAIEAGIPALAGAPGPQMWLVVGLVYGWW